MKIGILPQFDIAPDGLFNEQNVVDEIDIYFWHKGKAAMKAAGQISLL